MNKSFRPRSTLAARDAGPKRCPNCGGEIPPDTARCPYCGALDEEGAEREYLRQLDGLREDTGELAEGARRGFASNLRGNARWAAVLVFAAIVLIVAALAAANCAGKGDERRELADFQARESFRAQHFDELDRLYAAGDDAALAEYAWGLVDEPGSDALFAWTHMDYVEAYGDWEAVEAVREDSAQGDAGLDDRTWAVLAALRLAGLDEGGAWYSANLAQEEEARLAGYREEAWAFLGETLAMDRGEIEAFAADAKDSQGLVDSGKLRQALAARLG